MFYDDIAYAEHDLRKYGYSINIDYIGPEKWYVAVSFNADGEFVILYVKNDILAYTTCGRDGFFKDKASAERAKNMFMRGEKYVGIIQFKKNKVIVKKEIVCPQSDTIQILSL